MIKNQCLLVTGSELKLILGDPKCHHGPLVKVGSHEGQMNCQVLAHICVKTGSGGP